MARWMFSLAALLRRQRALVLALWLAAVAAAVPFAMRQSDHLTGGGYEVAGSQSAAVTGALARDFPSLSEARLPAVLVPGPHASRAQMRGALERLGAAVRSTPDVELAAAQRRRAE